jgi:hypothetical protein
MELKPEATAARQIDFGSGVCDDKASLVIGSFTTTIILR